MCFQCVAHDGATWPAPNPDLVSMAELLDLDLGRHSRRLHVETLVRLRWLALFGQTAALLFTYFVVGFLAAARLSACMVIAMSAALNIGLRISYGRVDQLNELPAAAVLAFDIIQLTALLYLTGGIENPFSMLFLAPIMISAVSLGGWITIVLDGSDDRRCVASDRRASSIALVRRPDLKLPLIYATGVWTRMWSARPSSRSTSGWSPSRRASWPTP